MFRKGLAETSFVKLYDLICFEVSVNKIRPFVWVDLCVCVFYGSGSLDFGIKKNRRSIYRHYIYLHLANRSTLFYSMFNVSTAHLQLWPPYTIITLPTPRLGSNL